MGEDVVETHLYYILLMTSRGVYSGATWGMPGWLGQPGDLNQMNRQTQTEQQRTFVDSRNIGITE